MVAVKSNALMDAGLIPNLELEVSVKNRSTLGLMGFGSVNVLGQSFRTLGVAPEYRYWIGGRPMVHLYVGVGLLAVTYDINWKGRIHKGDVVGGGLEFGYVKPLNKRWNMEISGGTALIGYYQHYYYEGDTYNPNTHHQNSHGFKMLPYKVGLSFAYIIK